MIWSVAIGGAMGSIARFLLGSFVQQRAGTAFPIGTLIINITGSILLGFLLRFALATPSITPATRALLTTGFCGGYTTFSTFSYETVALIEENELGRAALYAVLSVVIAMVGTYFGIVVARELLALRDSP
jgi:fluoride exporter